MTDYVIEYEPPKSRSTASFLIGQRLINQPIRGEHRKSCLINLGSLRSNAQIRLPPNPPGLNLWADLSETNSRDQRKCESRSTNRMRDSNNESHQRVKSNNNGLSQISRLCFLAPALVPFVVKPKEEEQGTSPTFTWLNP